MGESGAYIDNLGTQKASRRSPSWTVLILLALIFLREIFDGGTVLLRQEPEYLRLISYAAGFILGISVGRKVWILTNTAPMSKLKIVKEAFYFTACVVFGVVIASYLGRWAFELAAFSGHESVSRPIELRITGLVSGKSGTSVHLMSSADGREITVRATSGLFDDLVVIRPPLSLWKFDNQPYCITLRSEIGRWHALRAHVPKLWQKGLNEYHLCKKAMQS